MVPYLCGLYYTVGSNMDVISNLHGIVVEVTPVCLIRGAVGRVRLLRAAQMVRPLTA